MVAIEYFQYDLIFDILNMTFLHHDVDSAKNEYIQWNSL